MTIKKRKKVTNILCIRPDNMGDVLMTTPAMRALKESFPLATITLLASEMGSGIAQYIPEIDDVLVVNVPWVKQDGKKTEAFGSIVSKVKRRRFDAAVLFNVFSQNPLLSAFIAYEAGIPLRLGYSRENLWDILTDWIPDPEPFLGVRHEVRRQLDLVAAIGAETSDETLSLRIPGASYENMKNKRGRLIHGKKYIVLHPGASEKKRCFDPDVMGYAGKKLSKKTGLPVLVTGTGKEKHIIDRVVRSSHDTAFSSCGVFTLDEYAALVAEAALLISNNTGPVHIAAALKTPVVVTYALTNPQHTPWKVPSVVLPYGVPDEEKNKDTVLTFTETAYFGRTKHAVRAEDIVTASLRLLAGSMEQAPEVLGGRSS